MNDRKFPKKVSVTIIDDNGRCVFRCSHYAASCGAQAIMDAMRHERKMIAHSRIQRRLRRSRSVGKAAGDRA